MFGYCSALGIGGWVVMIGLWAAFLGLIVWAITRLFPAARDDRPHEEAPSDLVAVGRREGDSA